MWLRITGQKEFAYIPMKEAGDSGGVTGQLLAGGFTVAALQLGGLLDSLKKALAGSSRNGYSRKTVVTDTGRAVSLRS